MKKILVILSVVILVLGVAGGVYWFVLRDDSSDSQANSSQQSTELENVEFKPVTTDGLALEATVTTDDNGKKTVAVMKYDGKGNSEYEAGEGDEKTRIITTKEAFYTCNTAQGCFKYKIANGEGTNINPEDFDYSSEDAEKDKASITKEGQASCPAGTCDVWVSKDSTDNTETRIYIDTATGRISKVESKKGTYQTTIAYQYKDVTVEVPTKYQELPAGI